MSFRQTPYSWLGVNIHQLAMTNDIAVTSVFKVHPPSNYICVTTAPTCRHSYGFKEWAWQNNKQLAAGVAISRQWSSSRDRRRKWSICPSRSAQNTCNAEPCARSPIALSTNRNRSRVTCAQARSVLQRSPSYYYYFMAQIHFLMAFDFFFWKK